MINQFLQNEITVKLKDLTANNTYINDKDNILVKLYDLIKKDIKENGLSDKGTFITVDSSNKVMDGNHRVNILHELYGPEYEVTVLQWKFPLWVFSIGVTIIEFIRWAFNKAKALYSKVG